MNGLGAHELHFPSRPSEMIPQKIINNSATTEQTGFPSNTLNSEAPIFSPQANSP